MIFQLKPYHQAKCSSQKTYIQLYFILFSIIWLISCTCLDLDESFRGNIEVTPEFQHRSIHLLEIYKKK